MWSAQLPNGEVRSGTLEQLHEALRSGHLDSSTPVCASGSVQWARLADVLEAVARAAAAPPVRAPSVPAPAPVAVAAPPPFPPAGGSPELWQVRLAGGQIRSGTREQLEEAFRAGHLKEDMLVLAAGAPSWVLLGALLGRSEPPPPPVVAPVAPAAPVAIAQAPSPPPSAAPTSSSASGADEIWQVRLADGQVRSGTRLQLEEAFRAGHIDGAALVLAAGASEWVPLVTLAARLSSRPGPVSDAEAQPAAPAPAAPVEAPPPPAQASPEAPEAAEVALAEPRIEVPQRDDVPPEKAENGQAELQAPSSREAQWQVRLTYDQLQEAFRVGLLGNDSEVLAVGTDQWVRFGDLRGGNGSDTRQHEGDRA